MYKRFGANSSDKYTSINSIDVYLKCFLSLCESFEIQQVLYISNISLIRTFRMYNLIVFLLVCAVPTVFGRQCPEAEPCVWKCCPEGEMRVDLENRSVCAAGGPKFVVPDGYSLADAGIPDCESIALEEGEEHEITANGTVEFEGKEFDTYCIDWNNLNRTSTYICFEEEDIIIRTAFLHVYTFGLFLSIPLLFTTFVAYLFVPKNIYTIGVLVHVGSMTIAYSCLALAQNGYFLDSKSLCPLIGYAIQFFFLGTFFWLNVMCFDIYWAFSGIRKPTGSVKERDRKKLILYSIYAWGIPLLILLVTIAIDFSPGVPDTSIFKPKVGVEKCFFREYYATLIYFYMPMGIIIISNIILFSITAYRISSLRKETAVLKKDGSRKHDHNSNDKERFSLYFKLFLVMGINWVMELISALVGGPNIIWYVPDITNTLQGVFIFIIFVWKRRVRRLIWAKLNAMCGKELPNGGAKGQWSGSTRNTGSVTTTSGYSQNSVKKTPSNAIAMTPQVPDS